MRSHTKIPAKPFELLDFETLVNNIEEIEKKALVEKYKSVEKIPQQRKEQLDKSREVARLIEHYPEDQRREILTGKKIADYKEVEKHYWVLNADRSAYHKALRAGYGVTEKNVLDKETEKRALATWEAFKKIHFVEDTKASKRPTAGTNENGDKISSWSGFWKKPVAPKTDVTPTVDQTPTPTPPRR